MHIDKDATAVALATQPSWAETQVVVELSSGQYLTDDGRLASQASSCVIRPAVGDCVLVATGKDGVNYIVHLLRRSADAVACLSVPGTDRLVIEQANVALHASASIALRSLCDVDVCAATGVLSLNARNLFSNVDESLVENLGNYIGRVGQYLLDASELLRLHGRHASITAEQDVKVDAERISMG
ncbi:DUF3540 domain-containing protein [Massilia sp. CCM 9210]|uniref:DUF3540 domain-containing protein n=1 Tax=Massilia scottii TaxID=3057166 RepID=UPI00279645D6|nr:DUF3540 domain-containing protein [Massilia sp. CCM 9210]MDQ1812072.1 DUF3540 domain-containing protein [Massilia sp. CCM 9210]